MLPNSSILNTFCPGTKDYMIQSIHWKQSLWYSFAGHACYRHTCHGYTSHWKQWNSNLQGRLDQISTAWRATEHSATTHVIASLQSGTSPSRARRPQEHGFLGWVELPVQWGPGLHFQRVYYTVKRQLIIKLSWKCMPATIWPGIWKQTNR